MKHNNGTEISKIINNCNQCTIILEITILTLELPEISNCSNVESLKSAWKISEADSNAAKIYGNRITLSKFRFTLGSPWERIEISNKVVILKKAKLLKKCPLRRSNY